MISSCRGENRYCLKNTTRALFDAYRWKLTHRRVDSAVFRLRPDIGRVLHQNGWRTSFQYYWGKDMSWANCSYLSKNMPSTAVCENFINLFENGNSVLYAHLGRPKCQASASAVTSIPRAVVQMDMSNFQILRNRRYYISA